MKISAKIENRLNSHKVIVQTNNAVQELEIPGKPSGYGSAVNGGEFLFLALATCFCNDIYREAQKKNITITNVLVEALGEFPAEGEPGNNIVYTVKLDGNASAEELAALIQYTDTVAEVQNTLRAGLKVRLLNPE